MNKLLLILCLIAFLSDSPAGAGDSDYPAIKAGVNPESATVGSVMEYKITIAGKKLGELEIMKPVELVFYPGKDRGKKLSSNQAEKKEEKNSADDVPLYVIHDTKKEESSVESMDYITLTVKLSFYRPGRHLLPEIYIYDRDKVRIGYKVPEAEVKPVNQKGELAEIEPPLDLGGNYYRLIFLAAALVLAAIAAVFVFRYIKKKRALRAEAPVIIPPIEIFLQDIEALKPEGLIRDGRIDEFVVGISMIFRRFISMEFNIDAAEMTSDEIDAMLARIMPAHVYDYYSDRIMKSFLLWDLSKFAEFTPSEDILLANLENTKKLALNLSRNSAHA